MISITRQVFRCIRSLSLAAGLCAAAAPQAVATPWPNIAATITAQARSLSIEVEADEATRSVSLFITTADAFTGDSRELSPAFADFLADVASLLQAEPTASIVITGFGDMPATRYNPVQLGLRVRRLQSFLASHGVPVHQIRASVSGHAGFDGPEAMSGRAGLGVILEVKLSPS